MVLPDFHWRLVRLAFQAYAEAGFWAKEEDIPRRLLFFLGDGVLLKVNESDHPTV